MPATLLVKKVFRSFTKEKLPRYFISQLYAITRRFQQKSYMVEIHNRETTKATVPGYYAHLQKLHATSNSRENLNCNG